ncbi:MAG TPA: sigma-70 family RNA polymerase sigma factor [Candidatus Bathyarchaeia archaeon]|nr:sigma-70 family RNA polymerase sigma factor [Candidatus Bathyarchaeia archaeon]
MAQLVAYTHETPDAVLVDRARSGDADAFAALVRRYERPLYAYARRMLRSADEAEDVFQETFLRVHLHLDRFREGAPFRPWLYQIATNLCRDRQRWWRRRPQVSLDSARGGQPDAPTYADTLAAPDPGPDRLAREAEAAERLENAVARLPVKQRAVFLMARYDGLSYDEISKILSIPVGTVKSRMNTAVNSLLAAIQETD